MKRSAIILILLLLLPIISAVQVDIESELKKGETLIAKISGNFLEPVLKNNIYFYRGYNQVPFEFKLLKIEQDYFIYTSTLGKSSGNYSLVIKESEYYTAGGEISSEDITADFSISEEYADFAVTPGALTAQGIFSLEIQNLKNEDLIIYIDKNDSQEEVQGGFFSFLFGDKGESLTGQAFTLKGTEIRQIELEFEDVSEPALRTIQLSTENLTTIIFVYVLPVEEPETEKIKFEVDFFNISMPMNASVTKILYLINQGATTLEVALNISGFLQEYASIEPEFFEELEANETKEIILNITSKNQSEIIEGSIQARTSDGFSAYVELIINVPREYVPEEDATNGELPSASQTCQELGGIICNKTSECSIKTIESQNGNCCLGACEEKTKSPAGKIIGWAIIIGLVGLFIWFYFKKFRKTKRKPDLLKVAESKIKRSKRGKFEDQEW